MVMNNIWGKTFLKYSLHNCRVLKSTVYYNQGSIWLRVKILSSQSCHLEFLYIFERKLAYLLILIGSLRSLIIFYISHWGCFNLQKFSSLLTLYLLPDQNRIRGGECHTLRSKTLEIKNFVNSCWHIAY